jgi:hypothetical protein
MMVVWENTQKKVKLNMIIWKETIEEESRLVRWRFSENTGSHSCLRHEENSVVETSGSPLGNGFVVEVYLHVPTIVKSIEKTCSFLII